MAKYMFKSSLNRKYYDQTYVPGPGSYESDTYLQKLNISSDFISDRSHYINYSYGQIRRAPQPFYANNTPRFLAHLEDRLGPGSYQAPIQPKTKSPKFKFSLLSTSFKVPPLSIKHKSQIGPCTYELNFNQVKKKSIVIQSYRAHTLLGKKGLNHTSDHQKKQPTIQAKKIAPTITTYSHSKRHHLRLSQGSINTYEMLSYQTSSCNPITYPCTIEITDANYLTRRANPSIRKWSTQLYWPNQASNAYAHSRNYTNNASIVHENAKQANKSSFSVSAKQHALFNKLAPIIETMSKAQKTMPQKNSAQDTIKASSLKKRSTSYSGMLLEMHANSQIKDIVNQRIKFKVSKIKSDPKEIIYVISKM